MNDQLVTTQVATHNEHNTYPCPRRYSNPRSL